MAVTLTDATATGAALKAIDDATTGLVDASSVTSITAATVAQAKQVLVTNVATVTPAPGVTLALTDTTAAAADLNALDATTSGLVTAGSLTGLTGALGEVKSALEAITTGTALSAPSLNRVTLTDAVTASAFDQVVFANDVTLQLANVADNELTLVDATVGSGRMLTVDGTSATSSISINASAETDGSVVIRGGAGADTIFGGAGADTLTGGAGVDTFVFNAANRSTLAAMDTITDYRASGGANAGALDVIVITDIVTVPSNVNTVQDLSNQSSLTNALTVMANAATTNNGLGVFIWSGNTYVFIETVGAAINYGAGDTVIKLAGTPFAAGTSIVGLGIDGF